MDASLGGQFNLPASFEYEVFSSVVESVRATFLFPVALALIAPTLLLSSTPLHARGKKADINSSILANCL